MDSQEKIIINKKSNFQPYFTRLYIRFTMFFLSTLLLLIPLFYQAIYSQPFWNQNIILIFLIIGSYGYAFLIGDLSLTAIKEYGGIVGNFYKKYEKYWNLLLIIIVIISLSVIFYEIFGSGAVGPFIGGISVLLIKWLVEKKVQKVS